MKRSTLTPIVLGLAWLCSLGVVYTMGLFTAFAFHAEPGMGAESGLKSSEREAQALFEQLVGEPLNWVELRSYRPQDRHPPQLDAFIDALAKQPSAAQRRVLAERFFRVVGEVKTAALLQARVAQARAQPDIFQGLLAVWSEHDPASAQAFIKAMVQAGDAPEAWLERSIEHE